MSKLTEQKLTEIANRRHGSFLFKTNARKQFYPYEVLHYVSHNSLVVPLQRTAAAHHRLLDQHGFNLNNTHYIDLLADPIKSPLIQQQTKYLNGANLHELSIGIQKKMQDLGPGTKTVFLDQVHMLALHYGAEKTQDFIRHLMDRLQENHATLIMLGDHKQMPKELSKFFLDYCNEVFEVH